jgi:high-affinity iron transporter
MGAGPWSTTAVVGNTAVIVFREGLEAVLILAALMASMVGAQRHLRRPMLAGAAGALVATAITWVIARTIVSSLNRYGEKLEAVVSLVAIAVLLLILNWFFHRVYWTGHLAGLHRRKTGVLRGAGATLVGAQLLGLAALGFTSVYREGFETVLFLQALVIDAGTLPVLAGVGVGMVGTVAAGLVAVVLQRRLPYKRMLIVTGLMVAWVLVAMVGTTVQVLQKVGWLPVTPLGDFHFPSWVGLWSGVYPTWEGIAAQVGALALVVGSYLVLEAVRGRRRARLLAQPRAASAPAQPARPVSPREPGAAPAEPVGPHGASRPRVVV